MAGTVTTGEIANALKLTLRKVITDKDSDERLFNKYMEVHSMSDAWEDDLEVAGMGLASLKPEGTELATGTIKEGYRTRYTAATYGMKILITEEALEDNKYKEVIKAAKRLARSMGKTADYLAALVLQRMFNTAYTGGDGKPLGSATHTLAQGGTFSNVMGTPLSPSRAALSVLRTQAAKLPGHDGLTEGYALRQVICPEDQWETWKIILGSSHAPEAGEYNAINVFNDMGIELVANKFWNNTTTNYAVQTDCPDGIQWRWRRKPRSKSWSENDFEHMKYSNTFRSTTGWSDPRSILCVEA